MFDKMGDAKAHQVIYGGAIHPLIAKVSEVKTEDWAEFCDDHVDEKTEKTEPKSRCYKHLLNVFEEKRLTNGWLYVKELIYTLQNIRSIQKFAKLNELGIKTYCISTDSFIVKNTPNTMKLLVENFEVSQKLGGYKLELDAKVKGEMLHLAENKNHEFHDYSRLNVIDFEADEKEYKTSENFIKKALNFLAENNNVMIEAEYAGSGKSYVSQKFDETALIVAPTNVLIEDIQEDNDNDATTIYKVLGLDKDGRKVSDGVDLNEYKTVVFDEVCLNTENIYYKISKLMQRYKEIKYIANGDPSQIEKGDMKEKAGKLEHILRILFPNRLRLMIPKRLDNDGDIEKMKQMKKDIFATKPNKIFKLLKEKYGFKTINNLGDLITDKNICYYNRTSAKVSEVVHQRKYYKKYNVGMKVVTKEYLKQKGFSFGRNISFIIERIHDKIYHLKRFTNENTKITLTETQMEKYMKLPYCLTIDSAQGMTIKENYTIFDIGSPYVNAKYIWTMITRCVNFRMITLFEHSCAELDAYYRAFRNGYFLRKIENYKRQDDAKNRAYEAEKYLDLNWFKEKLNACNKCSHCGVGLELYTEGSSLITADRIDNSKPHHKDNCVCLRLHHILTASQRSRNHSLKLHL